MVVAPLDDAEEAAGEPPAELEDGDEADMCSGERDSLIAYLAQECCTKAARALKCFTGPVSEVQTGKLAPDFTVTDYSPKGLLKVPRWTRSTLSRNLQQRSQ